MEDPIELRKGFERAGRAAIRVQQEANRATGAPMQDREIEARKWLHELEEADALAAASKRDLREEETLSIARRALANSERANKIAISAIVFAVICAIISAVFT
ncbi:hypothetical protein [Roseateles sp. PN1]|uniref:hypothetical protein n=1 Tax=Roseateles sp. PN1 TaxID=3137372 RepID=UPI0031397073